MNEHWSEMKARHEWVREFAEKQHPRYQVESIDESVESTWPLPLGSKRRIFGWARSRFTVKMVSDDSPGWAIRLSVGMGNDGSLRVLETTIYAGS